MLFISCKKLVPFLKYLHFVVTFSRTGKRLDEKAKVNVKIYVVTDWKIVGSNPVAREQIIAIHVIVQYLKK